jgi:hypothetical protein
MLGIVPNTPPTDIDLNRVSGAGAGMVRRGLNWSAMQPREGGPIDFASVDSFMVRASQRGMAVDLVAGTTPRWARSAPDADMWEPPLKSNAVKAAWLRFIRAAVERYGLEGTFWADHPALKYRPVAWTIWNEPNLKRFWGGHPAPADFAQLMNMTGPAIYDVDPTATVVVGGVFCDWGWMDWLERFYEFVDKSSYDAFAFHPYGRKPNRPYQLMLRAREIMDANGDRRGETWIDEVSWGTDREQARFVVSKRKQAENMRILFQILAYQRDELKLEKVLWYGIRDDPRSNVCQFCASSGLWLADGVTPKPAWFVYRGYGSGGSGTIRGKLRMAGFGPLAKERVYLDLDGDGRRRNGEPTDRTNKRGRYKFPRLYPTKYTVRLKDKKDWRCAKPRRCKRKVEVAAGEDVRAKALRVRPRHR